jgi:hypothetical protein
MLNKFYIGLSGLVIGFYGVSSIMGWELGNPQRHMVPAGERKPGWSRAPSAFFWYSGYRGGK